MTYQDSYLQWLSSPLLDNDTRDKLRAIEGNDEEIKSRFMSRLSFGTAGLRGVMGAGTHMMNIYTVRQATQGFANVIRRHGRSACERGVVVAYDSRHMSMEFARETCRVFTANGIKTYIFDELRPTPELSFAIRDLGCIAGVNITASHNTREYNGYKAYWEDGTQLSPEQADEVSAEIDRTDIFDGVLLADDDELDGRTEVQGRDNDEKYIEKVLGLSAGQRVIAQNGDMPIVYTPFHGAGYRLVPEVLRRAGFRNIIPVEEQMVLDGDFPTVKSPNPENREGFALGMEYAARTGASLIVGTDPDSDRMGVIVKDKSGEYVALTGNQTGVILLDYIINALRSAGRLPSDACAVKTIVTTEMAARVCESNGVGIVNVLTGFKFIGGKAEEFKETGEHTFIFGYEESYGYLAGDYARDKDGVAASLLICEAAAYYASKGMTLADAMESLYEKYGYHTEHTINIYMPGLDGERQRKAFMDKLRAESFSEIAGLKVLCVKDYLKGADGLPESDVLYYKLDKNNVLVVRPSGTEPKVKIYIMTSAGTAAYSEKLNSDIEKDFKEKCS